MFHRAANIAWISGEDERNTILVHGHRRPTAIMAGIDDDPLKNSLMGGAVVFHCPTDSLDENTFHVAIDFHDIDSNKVVGADIGKQFVREQSNRLLIDKERIANSSGSLFGLIAAQPAPMVRKNTTRKVDKFYRKQSDLVDSYRKDFTMIEESRQRRQKSLPSQQSGEFEEENGKEEDAMIEKRLQNSSASLASKKVSKLSHKKGSEVNVSGQITVAEKTLHWLSMLSLITNVSLVIAKMAAAYLSGSLSIISSLVDSAVDITSGLVIWLTARAIKKRDPYMYPRGRTRLEPIALIIVSVIMGVASVQMIVQSLESIVWNTVHPRVDFISLGIMISTVLLKISLVVLCKKFSNHPSVAVLVQDHKNDCISNFVAIGCAYLASKYWIYLDPIGAIIVSLYIAISWYITGKEHLAMLSGKSAKPEFINRIVKVCVEHDERIDYIDTVYVYHYGTLFLVEVHIVLDPNMTLKESHDISEALQISIESLPDVERAFVHCDYEYDHLPADEHKVV